MSGPVGLWMHFARLADFRGREDRASFWPYAALVFVIDMIVGAALFVPIMVHAMAEMQRFAGLHPSGVTQTRSASGQYSITIHAQHHPQLFSAGPMALYMGVTFGLAVLLYAAAVTRRLHDRGMTGLWGLMPLPFIIFSAIMMPQMFASQMPPSMPVFFSTFFSNLLYVVTIVVLIVLLAGAGEAGPNRFDPV